MHTPHDTDPSQKSVHLPRSAQQAEATHLSERRLSWPQLLNSRLEEANLQQQLEHKFQLLQSLSSEKVTALEQLTGGGQPSAAAVTQVLTSLEHPLRLGNCSLQKSQHSAETGINVSAPSEPAL